MFKKYIVSTNTQKVLKFFSLHQGKACYEREVAKGARISYGSANSVLRELCKAELLQKTTQGRMCYYRMDESTPYIKEFKILVNLLILEPVIEKLKEHSRKIVLYGSWADGTDTAESDIDLFIVSSVEEKVRKIIDKYSNSKKMAGRRIQCIIYGPEDLLDTGGREKVFMAQVEKGKVLWEKDIDEDNL